MKKEKYDYKAFSKSRAKTRRALGKTLDEACEKANRDYVEAIKAAYKIRCDAVRKADMEYFKNNVPGL